MHYRMGVDVGGSHTDAVLLDENLCCVHGVKVPTTANVDSGIREAVERLGKESGIHPRQVKLATLGTTHCANAVVERKNLSRVGMIRIGAPATRSVPPMVGWPEDLKKAIGSVYFLVRGGREYNGTPIVPLDLEEIRHACRQMKGLVDAVAITAVFAPTDPADEDLAAEIVREELGASIPVTRSGELAGLGLLDRENATILNAALNRTANRVIEGFRRALEQAGMQANIFFGQNDGTMMPEKMARRFPIRMIACRSCSFFAGSGSSFQNVRCSGSGCGWNHYGRGNGVQSLSERVDRPCGNWGCEDQCPHAGFVVGRCGRRNGYTGRSGGYLSGSGQRRPSFDATCSMFWREYLDLDGCRCCNRQNWMDSFHECDRGRKTTLTKSDVCGEKSCRGSD